MYNGLRITAVVVAAGRGSRMGSSTRKQYLMLGGKPVVVHTLQVFQACSIVDDVVVVVPPGEEEYFLREIVDGYRLEKIAEVIAGGITRQQSVYRGLSVTDGDIAVIHDGVRPFLNCHLVEQGIRILLEEDCSGTACAVPVKDTIKEINREGFVRITLQREYLRAVQTPQCFYTEILREVYNRASREGIQATDDTALLEYYGFKVKLYPGSYINIKITTPEDMILAEALLKGGVSSV